MRNSKVGVNRRVALFPIAGLSRIRFPNSLGLTLLCRCPNLCQLDDPQEFGKIIWLRVPKNRACSSGFDYIWPFASDIIEWVDFLFRSGANRRGNRKSCAEIVGEIR